MVGTETPKTSNRGVSAALLVAVMLTVSLVGSCSSNPDLAARSTVQVAREEQVKARAAQEFRRQVSANMKQAAAERLARQRRAAAQRRAAQQRRAAAQRVARQRQAVAVSAAIQSKTVHVSQVLQYFGFSPFDLCAIEPKGGGRAQRQARRLRETRREQALRYLNLSCPSP